jgi:hypothetical protein
MRFVRHGLPLGIVLAGIVAAIASPERLDAAMLIVSAGLSVWLLGWFFRLGFSGDRERDAEDRARRYFDEHGHWPDERPPRP